MNCSITTVTCRISCSWWFECAVNSLWETGLGNTCGGHRLDSSLWNSSAVIVRTVLHTDELCLTEETAFLSGPAGFKSADSQLVSCWKVWTWSINESVYGQQFWKSRDETSGQPVLCKILFKSIYSEDTRYKTVFWRYFSEDTFMLLFTNYTLFIQVTLRES